MQLSGLIATALHSADRLLAGVLLGPQAMALVDLAAKLPTTAGSIGSSASTVAVSSSARHDVQGQPAALQQVYRDASRITVVALALALPFMAWFAEPIARAWLGQSETQAAVAPLLALLAVGLHAHMLTGPVNAVSRGRGSLRADFSYHGLRAVALAAALAVWWLGPVRSLPALVLALVAAQVLAAVAVSGSTRTDGCAVPGRAWPRGCSRPRWLPTHWRGLLHAVLLPSPAGGRADAIVGAGTAALLWLPSAAALLAPLLLSGVERHALAAAPAAPVDSGEPHEAPVFLAAGPRLVRGWARVVPRASRWPPSRACRPSSRWRSPTMSSSPAPRNWLRSRRRSTRCSGSAAATCCRCRSGDGPS